MAENADVKALQEQNKQISDDRDALKTRVTELETELEAIPKEENPVAPNPYQ